MSLPSVIQPVETPPAGALRERRMLARFGPMLVTLAMFGGLATFLVFAGFTPILPTNAVVLTLFALDAFIILILLGLVAFEGWTLYTARRLGQAGARLHMRIVGLFSVVASVPVLVIALVASVMLERGLNPDFMQDMKGFVGNTAEAARLYRDSQCNALLREADVTAALLGRGGGRALYDADRPLYKSYFTTNAQALGFTTAVILKRSGEVIERGDNGQGQIANPEPSDYDDAAKGEPICLVLADNKAYVVLRALSGFDDVFLYASRPTDPFADEFSRQAAGMIGLYDGFEGHRRNIEIAFAIMFVLLALIMILSAIWLGLSFATGLVAPIRRLIRATDEVSSGNLYVQVPVNKGEADLGRLGETFNKMTSELRQNQNRLMAANADIDQRRLFTEAVLSGVPVAVIGVNGAGAVSVLNPSAQRLFSQGAGAVPEDMLGRGIDDLLPELADLLGEARTGRMRLVQGQATLLRAGRERNYNVRVTSEPSASETRGFVVTLDDITDLVSAQRTSAWADVARRIAHEIKNPLTPIQLSAERLKRKYGATITQDRAIFDQCTDTIIRQVDDIKRMVDEFSSFARMPKARPERDDLNDCVRQVSFLMRMGHPEIELTEHLPDQPVMALFDRRLLSQALTNIIKNATEGVSANHDTRGAPGHVDVSLHVSNEGHAVIDVSDNGKGFPRENRQRLLEPYMTTRTEGTGLGLPIVAKILEDHGGAIELLDASADGPQPPGARVRLSFPISRPESAAAPSLSQAALAAHSG